MHRTRERWTRQSVQSQCRSHGFLLRPFFSYEILFHFIQDSSVFRFEFGLFEQPLEFRLFCIHTLLDVFRLFTTWTWVSLVDMMPLNPFAKRCPCTTCSCLRTHNALTLLFFLLYKNLIQSYAFCFWNGHCRSAGRWYSSFVRQFKYILLLPYISSYLFVLITRMPSLKRCCFNKLAPIQ